MGESYLFIVSIILYVTVVISCMVKLRIYQVATALPYLIAPLFPIIIIGLNLYVVFNLYKERSKCFEFGLVFSSINYFIRLTIVKLPLSLGCLCHLIKSYEFEGRVNIVKLYYTYLAPRSKCF